ncbi:MAG: BREX-1 system adenine-specific DNA-methyltransferase PglX [Brumimicrobium sp.]|nr:BREX-1 system adenine-specific DNA-methyltransferase PglX [Brumimicrobium sp.]
MDTSRLKKFAPEARRKLIDSVATRLDYILGNTDAVEFIQHQAIIRKLQEDVAKEGKKQLIDRVAYTWFNRFMALRYMDVNDYQPFNKRVISPIDGHTVPQLLADAERMDIPTELSVDKNYINDLLDGNTDVANPQNEVFKILLIASCNYLNTLFPFLFERINDYTELLLPNDLTSELSILNDFREGIKAEDCKEVEVIGWLYQFYISEKKDEVFASKGKVKKDEIPAATQLFTPRWIVEYMVQNTVGKIWLQNNPNSSLKEKMPYYIETESSQSNDFLRISSPEEITFLDQATGSGHILVYAFELLYEIYEEAGYNTSDIPQLIIEKNLYGYEIDERAAQLASFAVLMKAREYYRRIFRKQIEPNILCYQDLRLNEEEIKEIFANLKIEINDDLFYDLQCMQQATNLGSLIQPRAGESELQKVKTRIEQELTTSNLFSKYQFTELDQAFQQLIQLKQKFHCIVQNPPYMGGGKMNKELSDYVRIEYPNAKADLFSCFIDLSIDRVKKNGFVGNVTMESWMFLSSFEQFRKNLLNNIFIESLSHFGWHIMRIAFGTVAFIIRKSEPTDNDLGVYNYLEIDDIDKEIERPKSFPNIERRFSIKNQKDFEKIPGSNIGYWASEKGIENFTQNKFIDSAHSFQGLISGNNNKLMRYWAELQDKSRTLNLHNYAEAKNMKTWIPYQKGGAFRRWYGNNDYFLSWNGSGENLTRARTENRDYYFKDCISWTFLSSSKFGARRVFNGHLWDVAGSSTFPYKLEEINSLLGLLCTSVGRFYLDILNPTLNYQVENILALPIVKEIFKPLIDKNVKNNISISKQEWNSRETSWDFLQNELIRLQAQDIEEAIDLYKVYWSKKFRELHQNEEELNARFIEIYGLQEELTPDVPLDEITILKEELVQKELKEMATNYASGWQLKNDKWELENQNEYPDLPFDEKELIKQFISYTVGVMFGRYSLEKGGLILANQGERVSDFCEKIGKPEEQLRFAPDADAIVPVLEGEWFMDDINTQFREIVSLIWGAENLQRNMEFIEKTLGKTVRQYFFKDFYNDHIKRYKTRPIYWMFSSPSGDFNALIYMHRYDQDTLNRILTDYLRTYIDKLENSIKNLEHLAVEGTDREQTKAKKDIDKTNKVINELKKYSAEVFQPIALERINIDLDDGVLVNYNRFGKAIKEVKGLNDKKTVKKVKEFDWVEW